MTTKLLRRLLCRNVVSGVLAALLAVAPFAGGGLLSSLDTRPAAAQTAGDRAPDGLGVYGTPKPCPEGFEVLFDYKKTLRQFKDGFNADIPDEYTETVAELVVSAGEKKRSVDKSLCVRDLPPCPVSEYQSGQEPPVYMADPADPLFEHRGLDANFVARGQHVVDFGADFNAAWEAQTEAGGMGYRPSSNPRKGYEAENSEVVDHEPFAVMHPDRCVDAVAEPDPGYSECEDLVPEPIDLSTLPGDGGTSFFLPFDKEAFVFETTAETPVSMCVRFARKACPAGTLLTDVAQRFEPAAESDTDTEDADVEAPDPAQPPVPEEVVQRRCRGLVRRDWSCESPHPEKLNRFNRCTEPPKSPAAGQSTEPCRETGGTPQRDEAFRGFFGAAGCDDYVRGDFDPSPPGCSSFGFADVSAAGLSAGRDYPNDPYRRLNGYLADASLTVLSEVDADVDHWCKFKTGLLRSDCHGDKRPGKLDDCDGKVMKRESVCLITHSDSGGCEGIVHAIECLAVAAAIKANDKDLEAEQKSTVRDQDKLDELRELGKNLSDWQDYQSCAPCTDSPFDDAASRDEAVSRCDASADNSAFVPVDKQIEDWFKAYVYGRDVQVTGYKRILEAGRIQGALFNLGKGNALRPLGYPTADRPPCPDNEHNRWNLPTSIALDNYIAENIAGKWPVWMRSSKWQQRGHSEPTSYMDLWLFLDVISDSDASVLESQKRELDDYIKYEDRFYGPAAEQPAACFDLTSIAPGCRVLFSGSLSHGSPNGTGVVLASMRTDVRVHDLPNIGSEEARGRRWKPEPKPDEPDDDPRSDFVPAGQEHVENPRTAKRRDVRCDFAADVPHVELVVTEMWPDQQLDRDRDGVIDADGDFIEEFKRLFGVDSLDWWGLACEASEAVSVCGARSEESSYSSQVEETCEPDWSVEDCRKRLTALQGLRYLPDLDGDDLHEPPPKSDEREGGKRGEIRRRNQERVTCKVHADDQDPELDISCPWQPNRSGYFRIAAVAIWQIKHCVNAYGSASCDHTKPAQVRYGKMGAMTVSEPLGVVVYGVRTEGRSVALEDNLSLGS